MPISKLQHEFKHAGDFDPDLAGQNWNTSNDQLYQSAIKSHLNGANLRDLNKAIQILDNQ